MENSYDLGTRGFVHVTGTMAGGIFERGNMVEIDTACEIEDGCVVLACYGRPGISQVLNLYRYEDREGEIRLEPFRPTLKTRRYKGLPKNLKLVRAIKRTDEIEV
jgi:hypothetical protein